jgi:hypothetical protein
MCSWLCSHEGVLLGRNCSIKSLHNLLAVVELNRLIQSHSFTYSPFNQVWSSLRLLHSFYLRYHSCWSRALVYPRTPLQSSSHRIVLQVPAHPDLLLTVISSYQDKCPRLRNRLRFVAPRPWKLTFSVYFTFT